MMIFLHSGQSDSVFLGNPLGNILSLAITIAPWADTSQR